MRFLQIFGMFCPLLALGGKTLDFCGDTVYNTAMLRNLRIVCSVLAAACAAAAIFVFVYCGIAWGFACVAGAAVFFLLTLLFKRRQEEREKSENPPPPEGDFITGRVARGASDESDGDGDKDGDRDVENE